MAYTATVSVKEPGAVRERTLHLSIGGSRSIKIAAGQKMDLNFADVDQPVIFKSSNADVAVVDVNGKVTARKKGKCKFIAKIDSKTISITVNVTE